MSSRVILTLSLLVSVILFACATTRTRDIVLNNPINYRYNISHNGIEVAFDPYYEDDRLVEYFGDDILSKGIFPVFLVAKNNRQKPILFKLNTISLVSVSDGAMISQESANSLSTNINRERLERQDMYSGGSPILEIFKEYSVNKLNIIAGNIMRKSLQDRTVFHNETHGGFVYFIDNNLKRLRNMNIIYIDLFDLSTGKIFKFYFKLPGVNGE